MTERVTSTDIEDGELVSLKGEVVKGVSWLGAFRVVGRVLAFGKTAILARILTPAAFGVFGIVTIVLELLEVLTETGINIFLVQEKKDIDEYINTSWVISIVRGIVISLAIVLLAPVISAFFNSPDAKSLIYMVAIVPFMRGFINPSVVKFQKDLTFNKQFWYQSALNLVEVAVSVVFSIIMRSPVALIYGMAASAAVEVVLSFIVVSPRPRLELNIPFAKEIVGRGKWVTGAGIFNYFFLHGDDMVIGKVLGSIPLGLYQVGYRISILPITEVAGVFGTVALPVYVKIMHDKERLKKAFFRIVLGIALLVTPFSLLLFFFTKPIVLIVLGEQWVGAVDALRVLAVYGLVRAIVYPAYALFFAVKKQQYVTLITFAGIAGLFGSIFPLVAKYGIVGAAISALIGTLVTVPFIVICLQKVFKELK